MRIDPTLYEGRPAERREANEERCYELLDRLGVRYFRVDHDSAENIPDCELVEGLLGCGICKNLFLTNRQQTDFYLLIMPGEKPFKTKLLSKQIGTARLSFGSPADMERLLDLKPGSVSVLGLMNDKGGAVQLLVDRELLEAAEFGCHPCRNTTSLRFSTAELFEKLLPAMNHAPRFVELPWDPDAP
ncbi:MAG: prolyl-tRNA synthetase associated domain-containing protein [Oscillospiraceae bacterium]|nr:prolyl-tRNA synthetase associated domain-containing protein [Oscillospiraceae bacterium]